MARRKKKTRRGSDEAIAKRKAARALNSLFDESGAVSLDGRTLKRKRRLMKELAEGKGGRALTATQVLQYADELLSLGETLSSLRKLKPKVPATPPLTEESGALYVAAQKEYGFDPKAWKLLGVDIVSLTA